MEHYRAYHYKVLLFEQEPSGRFKPPDAYVPTALAAVTTHDLPTLRGWWEEGDLALRDRLDLYPSAEFKAAGARDARVGAARAVARAGGGRTCGAGRRTSRCRRIRRRWRARCMHISACRAPTSR